MEYAGMMQDASIASQRGTIGGMAQAKLANPRIFQTLMQEVRIALEESQPARAHLTELMSRIGVPKIYNESKGIGCDEPCEPAGEFEQLRALISEVQEAARDLRRMAGTLEERL